MTTLAFSTTTPTAGSNLTMTASLGSAAISGSVEFFDGTTSICSSTLTNGQATCVVTAIRPGVHTYYAVYAGDSVYSTSRSLSYVLIVPNARVTHKHQNLRIPAHVIVGSIKKKQVSPAPALPLRRPVHAEPRLGANL